MKTLLFAAALTIGGSLAAQTTNQQTPPPAAEPQPSGITTTDGTVPGDGITQQGTDPQGVGTPPAGTNEPLPPASVPAVPMANQQAAFTPQAAPAEYPPCSRTVTDSCRQTYERGPRR